MISRLGVIPGVFVTWKSGSTCFDDDAIGVVLLSQFQKSLLHLSDEDAAKTAIGHFLDIDVVELCDLRVDYNGRSVSIKMKRTLLEDVSGHWDDVLCHWSEVLLFFGEMLY